MRAFQSIDDVTLQIYDSAGDPEMWPAVLERFRLDLNAAGTALIDYDFAGHACRVIASAGTRPDFVRCYEQGLAQQIPWIQDGPWYALGRVSRGHEIIGDDELARSPVYNEWLKPNDLFHRLCGVIGRRDDRVLFLVASRPPASGRYQECEVRFLNRLLPHLRRAARLSCKILSSEMMAMVFEHLPQGVFVVDGTGRPVLMNHAAEDLLTRGELLLDQDGRLAATDDEASAQLHRALAGLSNGERSAACDLTAPRQDGDHRPPLPISVIPMGQRARDIVTGEGRILVIAAPQHAPEWQARRLREIYGLTAAEERLARLIVQGFRLDESEAALGIRHSTARTHMRRIYAKTGTRRQAELVRLLTSGQSPLDYGESGAEELG